MIECRPNMKRGKTMKRLALAGLVCAAVQGGLADGLPAFFAPESVATPPTFARRDLCVTADGEIRHYGVRLGADGRKLRVYIASCDGGRNWTMHVADTNDVGAVWKSPWSDRWIALGDGKGTNAVCALISKKGPGDTAFSRFPQKEGVQCEPRQILALRSRRRWIAPASAIGGVRGYEARVFLSDDDGSTWRMVKIPDTVPLPVKRACDATALWRNPGCEPTVAELSDGTLLLAVRASEGHHWFFRSHDAGETWEGPECASSFYSCNTMPLFLTLRDGRLLFFWNNSDPLPKPPADDAPELSEWEIDGRAETAFTNRDVLHAAISEDDGKTWRGFREIALNPIRNEPDFRERGNFPDQELDKSVHQSQAMELPDGKVMLAAGQNVASRRIYVFDPKWLYETDRTEDFRHGFENLTTHLYVRSLSGGWRGWAGHCCWNRVSGALLVRDPFEISNREVLQLCRIRDPRLVSDVQGVAWNFPASRAGVVTVEARVEGSGFRLALCDRWFNASDPRTGDLSLVSVDVDEHLAPRGAWHAISVRWDCDSGMAEIVVDGKGVRAERLRDLGSSFGPSYLHLQTLAEDTDPKGSYFRSFTKRGIRQ